MTFALTTANQGSSTYTTFREDREYLTKKFIEIAILITKALVNNPA